MKILILIASLMLSVSAFAEKPSEADMLVAASQSQVVAAYFAQGDSKVDLTQLQFVIAPNTRMVCTLMADNNSCSMSFRVLDHGNTLMSGAMHFDGQTNKYSIFRILDGAPRPDSDFEAFSRTH